MKSGLRRIALLAGATCTAIMADSIPYSNPGTIAPEHQFQAAGNGDVSAYFYGTGALFTEELGLFVNGVQQGGWALQDHISTVGQSVDFGAVKAGDSLVFALKVEDTHYTVYSNSNWNPDGINHTYATPFSGAPEVDPTIPSGMFVGFEDELLSFSDLNYKDEEFVLTNVATSAVPEPGSCTLLVGGALALAAGFVRRKR